MNTPSGREVILTSSTFSIPAACASCLARPATSVTTKKRKGLPGRGSETLSIEVPYCDACGARARSEQWKEIAVTAAVPLVAALFAGVSYLAPALKMPVIVALATSPALLLAVLAMTVLRPKKPTAPATAAGEAVRITAFEGTGKATLYCTNGEWADRFVAANGQYAHGKPKSRGERFALMAVPLALLAGPGAGYGMFLFAHPFVHVDNASSEAISVFVDGKKALDVGAGRFEMVRVGRGSHTLGYASAGAASPSSTMPVEVKVRKVHLYNPGKSACYWLQADAYGAASVDGIAQGPQPIAEFYRFDRVDTWFGDNPRWVKVDEKSSGDTRVALQRAVACMQLAAAGCSLDARERLIECERAATSEEADDACVHQAELACPATAAKAAPRAAAAAPGPKPPVGKTSAKKK